MQYYVYAQGSGNSYTIDLQRHLRNIQKVELLTVSVSRGTEYNITNGSNCFSINTTVYSIPNGRYTGARLAQVLTNIIAHMSVSYLEESHAFLFSHGNQPFTLSLHTSEILKRLGFTNTTHTSVDHATTIYSEFVTGQLVYSDIPSDLNVADDVLLLDIEELRTDAVLCNQSDRTFGVIGPGFETFNYEYNVVFEQAIPRVSRLTVHWLKSDGSPVNFNGQNENSFLLRFTCRKSNDEGEEEKEPLDEALLIKKIQRVIDDSMPPDTGKKGIPRFVYVLIIIVLASFLIYRVTA